MELRALGTVEAITASGPLPLGPPQRRTVLACLLVDAGRPVLPETLLSRVWDDPPPGARRALHAHITRLRQVLGGSGESVPLTLQPGGYVLDVPPDRVDLHRFRRLISAAQEPNCPSLDKSARLTEALALWRGDPMGGLPGDWAARVREGLVRQRLNAAVLLAENRLSNGDRLGVIALAHELLVDYPLAEPLVAVLMRALAAEGRAAEALDTFAKARRRLADELGTDPGTELRRIHQAILCGREAGVPATVHRDAALAGRRPALLPPSLSGFAGRDRELAHLESLLTTADDRASAVPIVALCGMPGVGKTSLAVHWAHQIRERFPDGQLYLNLRGFDPSGAAMTPPEAVIRLLYALGAPANRIPAPVEAQLDLLRTELAGRRVLLVLDNARDAEQIRPLLPGEPGCFVVLTSRQELLGLVAAQGAQSISVDPLTDTAAQQMLAGRLGNARTSAEPDAVREIVERCGRLPLALAVTAARLATRPGLSIAAVARELRDAQGGLDAFDGRDPATDLRAVFSWSYRLLTDAAATMFRLLALHPGPEISTAAAASLAGLPVAQVRELLAELTGAHLTVEHSPDRYSLHDLVRAYATEQLTEHEDGSARLRLVRLRMFDHYVHTAHAAAVLLDPHRRAITLAAPATGVTPESLADHAAALRWFNTEHAVLMVIVEQALTSEADTQVALLAWSVTDFLQRQGHWHDQATVQRAAVAATGRAGHRQRQADARRNLGLAYAWLGRYEEAHAEYAAALGLFTDLADRTGQAHTHRGLAWLLEQQHREAEALQHAQQAFALFRAAGEQRAEARALNMIGWYHGALGDPHRALPCCQEALRMLQRLGDAYGQAATWDSLGYIRYQLGHHQHAAECYRRALELLGELGDRFEEANTLVRLGDACQASGAWADADQARRRALEIFEQLDHPMAADVRARLIRPDLGKGIPWKSE